MAGSPSAPRRTSSGRRSAASSGGEELVADPRFKANADRVKNNATLIPIIQDALAQQRRARIGSRSSRRWACPSEPVLTYDEAVAHPQGQARGLLVDYEDADRGAQRGLFPPVRLEGTPARIRRAAPDLDQHGAEIRAWLPGGAENARGPGAVTLASRRARRVQRAARHHALS